MSKAFTCAVVFIIVIQPAVAEINLHMTNGHGGIPINIAQTGQVGQEGILFIHGNGQSYLSWHKQLNSTLVNKYHLVAYDLRGHGNSGKPWRDKDYNQACIWADDIDAVLEATGLTKPIVVAWSRGGLIAMHYVRCRGTDNLSGIVMVGARGRLVNVSLPPSNSPARVSQAQLETNDIEKNILGARTFSRLMTAVDQGEEWNTISTTMNILAPPYARRAMRSPVIGPTGDIENSYTGLIDEIKIPFLVILGASDPLRDSEELANAYRAAMPEAEVLIYPGVGHSPFLEAPERFNGDLRNFTEQIFDAN